MENRDYEPILATSKQQGQQVIDAILEDAKHLSAMSHHDKSGYGAHSDGWVDYTDHSDYSDDSG